LGLEPVIYLAASQYQTRLVILGVAFLDMLTKIFAFKQYPIAKEYHSTDFNLEASTSPAAQL
jgi:hypothetical protein